MEDEQRKGGGRYEMNSINNSIKGRNLCKKADMGGEKATKICNLGQAWL